MQELPAPPAPEDIGQKKGKGKAKVNKTDKGEGEFQTASKTVNVIFGEISGTASKRSNKLVLREIMAIEPAAPTSLKWSKVPITFSRKDQCINLSEPS